MAYRIELTAEVREATDRFRFDLRRAWDLRMSELIADPLPRREDHFSIIAVLNEFGDRFLSLVADELPFVVQYDLYDWPPDEPNEMDFEGRVRVWRLAY